MSAYLAWTWESRLAGFPPKAPAVRKPTLRANAVGHATRVLQPQGQNLGAVLVLPAVGLGDVCLFLGPEVVVAAYIGEVDVVLAIEREVVFEHEVKHRVRAPQ